MKLLLIIALSAMAAYSATAADLAGTWKGSMATQGGETAVTIIIKPGAVLTGSIQAGEYEAPIKNAKVSGDNISFEMNIVYGTLMYDGTVSGNEIRFEVTGVQGDKYTLICKRQ